MYNIIHTPSHYAIILVLVGAGTMLFAVGHGLSIFDKYNISTILNTHTPYFSPVIIARLL